MKITQDVRDYAAEMERKAAEFRAYSTSSRTE